MSNEFRKSVQNIIRYTRLRAACSNRYEYVKIYNYGLEQIEFLVKKTELEPSLKRNISIILDLDMPASRKMLLLEKILTKKILNNKIDYAVLSMAVMILLFLFFLINDCL